MLLFISCLTFLLLITIYLILKQKHTYWTNKGVVQLKPEFFFGNIKSAVIGNECIDYIWLDAYRQFKKLGVKHGGIYKFYKPIWIPIDIDLIKNIMFKDFHKFSNRGYIYNHKNDILSNHLFNVGGDSWKNMRSKLTPVFTSGRIKLMYEILNHLSNQFLTKIDDAFNTNQPLNITKVAPCYLIDVIANTAFGLEMNTMDNQNSDFIINTQSVLNRPLYRVIIEELVSWEFLGSFGYRFNTKKIDNFFFNLIQNAIGYRVNNNINRKDLLQAFIDGMNRKENKITYEEIAANTMLIIVAGIETTAHATAFMLYELSRHQDIQEKVRKEIYEISQRHIDGKITYDDLQDMKYSEMVIQETLRLHSVATVVPRQCSEDYQIPGSDIIIEKGTSVLIPSWGLQKDPEYWMNPEEFNPENFNNDNKSKRTNFTYLPFGNGPRICIGKLFATIQLKIILIKSLMKYKYELNSKSPKFMEHSSAITLRPKETILLDLSLVGEAVN